MNTIQIVFLIKYKFPKCSAVQKLQNRAYLIQDRDKSNTGKITFEQLGDIFRIYQVTDTKCILKYIALLRSGGGERGERGKVP